LIPRYSPSDTHVSQAARDADASKDMLADLFSRIENFFKRLESYKLVSPTPAMTNMIVKIMIEVLSILSIATTEIKQGRRSENLSSPSSLADSHFIRKILEETAGEKRY
jgi:hypothetical protein